MMTNSIFHIHLPPQCNNFHRLKAGNRPAPIKNYGKFKPVYTNAVKKQNNGFCNSGK